MAIPEFYWNGFNYVYVDWNGQKYGLSNASDPEEAKEEVSALPIWGE